MTRTLTSRIALSALMLSLAAPVGVMAQDAPAQTVPAAPPATSVAAPQLPQALRDLGLTDVKARPGKRGGQRIGGTLPDGKRLEAFTNDQGQLMGVFAKGGQLPAALTGAMVPQSVRDQDVFAQFTTLSGVMSGERGVLLAGSNAEGEKLRAAFAQDGTLMRFGRGDEGRHGRGDFHDRDDRGPRGDRGPHAGPRDGQRDGRGPHRDGPQGDGPRDAGPRGEGPGRAGPGGIAPIDLDAIRSAAEAAGYTGLGVPQQRGPGVFIAAQNPQGEAVIIELDPQGTVLREIVN